MPSATQATAPSLQERPAAPDTTPDFLTLSRMPPPPVLISLVDRAIVETGRQRQDVDRFEIMKGVLGVFHDRIRTYLGFINADLDEFDAVRRMPNHSEERIWHYLSRFGPEGAAIGRQMATYLDGFEFREMLRDAIVKRSPAIDDADGPGTIPVALSAVLEANHWVRVNSSGYMGVVPGSRPGRTQMVNLISDAPGRFMLASPVVDIEGTEVPRWMSEIEVGFAWGMLGNRVVLMDRLNCGSEGPALEVLRMRVEMIAYRADELEEIVTKDDRL